MSARRAALGLILAAGLAGCEAADPSSASQDAKEKGVQANPTRDVVSTALDVDLETRSAKARIVLAKSNRRGATLEVQGLTVRSVVDADGAKVPYAVHDGLVDLGVAARKEVEVEIAYGFEAHRGNEGLTSKGSTFLWPTFCGNLFPCKSVPSDGVRFSLDVHGGDGTIVAPRAIPADAPIYMIAWAQGDYEKLELGTTKAGTRVSVFHRPDELDAAREGSESLLDAFGWLESTYGAYLFGDDVGSVSVDWGAGAFGGMEHHPYWHVSRDSMADAETHVHEAAHGWFGDGVRLACWEDLVLSEGTTSYATARAIESVRGAQAAADLWSSYERRLDAVVASDDRIARPDGCDEVDVLGDLWNDVVYMKGAFFYRAVADEVGADALDRALARFYAQHRGGAAGVDDMVQAITDETGFDASPLADGWLHARGRPDR
jgi:hypothetical protein